MSNVNVTEESGQLSSDDYTVPQGQTYVSFYSDVACTVCFQNQATFGISLLPLAAGETKELPIRQYTTTKFEPIFPNNPCGVYGGATTNSAGVHTIVIS